MLSCHSDFCVSCGFIHQTKQSDTSDGVLLSFSGPVNDELILHTFTDNKEPVVKELNDQTFEHLTQASTGATTGDWLVML